MGERHRHTDGTATSRGAFVWVAEGEGATEDAPERKQRDGEEKDRTPSLVNNAN